MCVRSEPHGVPAYWEDASVNDECGRGGEGLAAHCLLMVGDQGHGDPSDPVGYGIVVLKVAYYNNAKLQAMKAVEEAQMGKAKEGRDEEAKKL